MVRTTKKAKGEWAMKYIIMCGGKYDLFTTPKQLTKINGEELVARTIRLLKENGIEDIAISSKDKRFDKFNYFINFFRTSFIMKSY